MSNLSADTSLIVLCKYYLNKKFSIKANTIKYIGSSKIVLSEFVFVLAYHDRYCQYWYEILPQLGNICILPKSQ